MRSQQFLLSASASIIVSLALISAASGAPITMSFQVGDNPPTVWTPEPVDQVGTTSHYEGFNEGAVWECDWTVSARSNPLVSLGAAVTNTSASTQIFTLRVTAPVSPVAAPSEIMGSVSGSLTDANGEAVAPGVWAQLTDAGPNDALYTALVDGSSARTLHDTITVIVDEQFDSANIPPANFGIPNPEAGPAVTNDIGIQLRFTLSPGDTASFTSVFNVVPEPATLGLLGLGGLFMFRRRRLC